MEDYNSRHTGPVIDDAVDRAKEGGALDQSLSDKAPAGYGLGEQYPRDIDGNDANNATASGLYWISTDTLNTPTSGWNGIMDVKSRTNTSKAQIIYYFADDRIYVVIRNINDGTVGEWEWLNPPMTIGVEYRTTKRIAGKPVYQKFFSLGSLVVGSNVIGIGENIGTWINIIAITDGYGNDVTNHANVTNVSTENSAIKITLTQASNLLATVEYIKTTD